MKEDITLKTVSSCTENGGQPFALMRSMYNDYVLELRKFSNNVNLEQLILPEDNPEAIYCLIYTRDIKTPIGFVIYGKSPNSFSRHDLYIGEFFIIKSQRNKGIGSDVLNKLIDMAEKDDLDITFFILDKNLPSIVMTSKTLEQRGYNERFSVAGIKTTCCDNKDIKFYYYMKAG